MEFILIPFAVAIIGSLFLQEVLMDDFDLDMLEREMDAMTREMSAEEIAEMEREIKNGFDFGQTFEEIFGG